MGLHQTEPNKFEAYCHQAGRRYAVVMQTKHQHCLEHQTPQVNLHLKVSSRRHMETQWLEQRLDLNLTKDEARALALALCPELSV